MRESPVTPAARARGSGISFLHSAAFDADLNKMYGINAGLVLGLAGALGGVIMAALALAMSRAPGWKELRSFALVALAASAYCGFGLVHVVPVSDPALLAGEMLALAASFVYGLVWIRHLAVVGKRGFRRWERATMVIGGLLVVLALVPGMMIVRPIRHVRVEWLGVSYVLASATILALVGVAFIVVTMLIAAFSTGNRWKDGWHARLPVIGAGALAVTGVADTLGALEILPLPQLIEPVTVVVVGTLAASYGRRFVADAQRLEALSEGLEREVAARTSELLQAQAAVATQERLAGLGRMAAGVAHEINNPTAVIQHNVDLLRMLLDQRGLLSPEITERLERSRDATRRIADIVRLLLDTSRGPEPAVTEASVFEVAPVVQRALAAVSIAVPGLHVAVRLSEGLCARGEPGSIEQVVVNLVLNAEHAARDVGGGARVRIEGERAGERAVLRVIDNGHGIPDSIRDRLFEPFVTTKPIGEGTGLGLAVSRGLVARHAGTIDVARTSSEGTEIRVELPAADASELQGTLAVAAELPLLATPATEVLVIEDDEDLLEVLTLLLDRFFRITPAASVDDALAMAHAKRYDVVLCDVMMPGGGAEAWLAKCATLDPQLGERTILLTGGPTTAAATSLLETHADRVLFKPVDVDLLRPLIERMAKRAS